MKKSRLVIVLLISCALLCCTAQAVTLRINVVDDKTDDALADASIYIDGDYVGSTRSDGTYSYVHSGKKDLYLKVVRKGYRNWVDYIDYDATHARVDMVREDETLTFELYDAVTLKPVVGAVVRVEGDDYSDSEVTGKDGSVDFSVRAGGSYSVEVRASGYHDLEETVELAKTGGVEDGPIQYFLLSKDLLGVRVLDADTSAPLGGAEVYIDNARAGVTDAEGRLQLHLERGKRYSLRVTATDYQPYLENRDLEADDVLLQVRLSKSAYSVLIKACNEATTPIGGAEVYLNGTLQGKTGQDGRFVFTELHAGTYEILVRASGYKDWSEIRHISGVAEAIFAELQYDRASVTVRVEGSDRKALADAVIVIDEKVVGVTDSLGRFQTALVTNRAYTVTAARDGYQNISVDADIPLGATEFTVPLIMEQNFNVWVLVAGIGVVAVLLLAVVMVVRQRRAGQNRGRPRRPDSL
ncbi:PEGA domain protein [Methanoculleus chikugoensis]|uniref:PEGA domain protein n=1 Tax=Methanoculleus chikugoensis TaxID=118126 RepID=A0A1M4MNR9_9EURY|nr:carboxypeptidase regulatory-like domain-containing protein [Methanoculleus chikugoensis]SCL76482.1 PEGA domain protein [Methanoculleus chikugoensis]